LRDRGRTPAKNSLIEPGAKLAEPVLASTPV
jgi:hypothetical protein